MDLGVQDSIVRRYFSHMKMNKSFQTTQNANVDPSFAQKKVVVLSFTILQHANSLNYLNRRSPRKICVSMKLQMIQKSKLVHFVLWNFREVLDVTWWPVFQKEEVVEILFVTSVNNIGKVTLVTTNVQDLKKFPIKG
jgi:hypothetical protein